MDTRFLNAIATRIRRRLRSFGLSSNDSRKVANRVHRLLLRSGLTFGLDYLKKAGTLGFIRIGYNYQVSSEGPWVKTHDGRPCLFKELFKYPEHVVVAGLSMARAIRFPAVNARQIVTAVKPVVLPSVGWTGEMCREISRAIYSLGWLGALKTLPMPLSVWTLGAREHESLEDSLTRKLQECASAIRILGKPSWFRDVLWPIGSDEVTAFLDTLESDKGLGAFYSWSQDRGGKLRLYAYVSDFVQCLLSPVQLVLSSFNRTLSTDCTFRQESGHEFAIEQLRLGKDIYSIDLSDATHRFPLSVQLFAARQAGMSEECLALVETIAKTDYSCAGFTDVPHWASFLRDTPIRWAVGQPLGTYFSFPLFAFTHNAFLSGLSVKYGLSPKDTFRVLGDDVIITDHRVKDDYVRILTLANVPISLAKSLSGRVAEFAGAKIKADYVCLPGSFKDADIKSMFSLMERFGPNIIHSEKLPSRWRMVLKLHGFIRETYFPDVTNSDPEVRDNAIHEYKILLRANSSRRIGLYNMDTGVYHVRLPSLTPLSELPRIIHPVLSRLGFKESQSRLYDWSSLGRHFNQDGQAFQMRMTWHVNQVLSNKYCQHFVSTDSVFMNLIKTATTLRDAFEGAALCFQAVFLSGGISIHDLFTEWETLVDMFTSYTIGGRAKPGEISSRVYLKHLTKLLEGSC